MSVADLLVPNPYPLSVGAITAPSITTAALTVTGTMFATAAQTTLTNALVVNALTTYPPVAVSSSSPNSNISTVYADNTGKTATFGLNSIEVSPSAFVFTPGDVKLGPGSVERIRFASAGIPDTPLAATTALFTQNASTVVVSKQISEGPYTPTWTNVSGFSGTGTAAGFYQRSGNIVNVTVIVTGITAAIGPNTGTVTLPITPAAFSAPSHLIGVATFANASGNTTPMVVFATTSATNATVSATSTGTAADIKLAFMYTILG